MSGGMPTGAEIVAEVATHCFGRLKAPPMRLGMPEHPTPSSRGMIPGIYPDAIGILRTVGQMLGLMESDIAAQVAILAERRHAVPIDVPDPFFKGPF